MRGDVDLASVRGEVEHDPLGPVAVNNMPSVMDVVRPLRAPDEDVMSPFALPDALEFRDAAVPA